MDLPAGDILIIEDDDDIRAVYSTTLRSAGYRVVTVADGEEALLYLRVAPVPPRLILLDLMMPRMNGWQFRAAQRRIPALADIPVVVISAVLDHPTDEPPLEAAASLRKPVDIDTLVDTVERFGGPPADTTR